MKLHANLKKPLFDQMHWPPCPDSRTGNLEVMIQVLAIVDESSQCLAHSLSALHSTFGTS